MPYCPNTKTTILEWNQWPGLDLSIHNVVLNHANGGIGSGSGSAISELKAGLADPQSLQGARAVSRTLLQCLRQVEKIDDGNTTQELEASILANTAYGTIMSALAAAAITPASTAVGRDYVESPSDHASINAQEQSMHLERLIRETSLGAGFGKAASAPQHAIHLTTISNAQAPVPPLRRTLFNHAHAAVQEAHDGTSIHLSRLLASLHRVMPSTSDADEADLKHHQALESQMQHAHDLLSELESKPTSATEAPKAPDVKPKKRSQQVLCRTDNSYDQLQSAGESELEVRGLTRPHATASAAVDFSDVSLDWGLGKLERCTNLPDFSSRVLQIWFLENFANPYPDDATKRRLIAEANITERQLGNWLSNTRVRVWKPLLEKQRLAAAAAAAAAAGAAAP